LRLSSDSRPNQGVVMEQQQHPQSELESAEVIQFPEPGSRWPARREQPPPTDEELAEYRTNRARLMRMLDEWEQFRGEWKMVKTQCPVASRILDPD
jgi:hypothetical protein